MQQRLKSATRTTGTRIIATEFLEQFLLATHNAIASLDLRFGWEALSPFATDFESNWRRGIRI
jgi:hypothetical protein